MNIFNHGPYKSQFCVKWVGAMLYQENGLAITFAWQNEPWYMGSYVALVQVESYLEGCVTWSERQISKISKIFLKDRSHLARVGIKKTRSGCGFLQQSPMAYTYLLWRGVQGVMWIARETKVNLLTKKCYVVPSFTVMDEITQNILSFSNRKCGI